METRLILQEGLLELLLELGWYLVKVGCSQNLISSNKFSLSICGFWNCHQVGRDHLFVVELYVDEF